MTYQIAYAAGHCVRPRPTSARPTQRSAVSRVLSWLTNPTAIPLSKASRVWLVSIALFRMAIAGVLMYLGMQLAIDGRATGHVLAGLLLTAAGVITAVTWVLTRWRLLREARSL